MVEQSDTTTPEMVRRVKDAIEQAFRRQRTAAACWGLGMGIYPAVNVDEISRAAIEAMWEPTEEMLKAKVTKEDADLPVDTVEGYLDYWNAGAVWRAMMAVALGR